MAVTLGVLMQSYGLQVARVPEAPGHAAFATPVAGRPPSGPHPPSLPRLRLCSCPGRAGDEMAALAAPAGLPPASR